ncbi:peptide/nickel transport system ATP-binding protein [Motilibacter rhizosphaerae]|uniref:Peptide/nickel transport system ATP-binding protein n=1 Tax=Motilibacter rhizosphaerae TaxID=598652 RepID=A0A4Q7NSF7_9ACTN|nr:ABC transporter ATP-binding protein [Motilibacter rhizosphaerae]RZS89708.1 peptide/nickel transport system ATP-binding protein [Motilibacter rhizosphaerae]
MAESPAQAARQRRTDLVAEVTGLWVSLQRRGVRSDVVRGVDLEVRKGEILGLVGESGSGKSVLGLTLLGLLPQASEPRVSGRVVVAGTDMVHGRAPELRAVRRQHLGAVFQDPMTSLNPTMRVGRQVTEVSGDRGEAVRLLTRVGVPRPDERLRSYPHELSGGLRQRVMAAIALSGTPSLVIADEPTTALDVTVQAQLLDLLRELRDDLGCSVLFVTHDLAVAAQLTDRIAVLYAGRVAETGATAEVLRRPAHPYTAGLLRSRLSLTTPRGAVLPTLPEETASSEERMRGCAYHSRCPLVLERCATDVPPLAGLDVAPARERRRACWRSEQEVAAYAASRPAPLGPTRLRTDAQGDAVVEVSRLCKDFSQRQGWRRTSVLHALRDVDLVVARGEAVSVVGESGSGKSTLLRVLAGLTEPTSGTAVVRGRRQMVFQDAGSSLTPWMSVGDLLREQLRPLRLDRRAADARIAEVLGLMQLPAATAQARPGELSGGQRQRVALARAVVVAPDVLLCDEPTSALDASLAAGVLNLVRELRAELGMAVLFVTHDLSVARLMGDRIVVMRGGKVVEDRAAEAVVSDPQHAYTRALLQAVPEIAAEGQPA